ncbi:hypothetical protein OROMI_007920 [Orobanche minor]
MLGDDEYWIAGQAYRGEPVENNQREAGDGKVLGVNTV